MKTFEGKTVEEAITQAMKTLQMSRDQLTIQVLVRPKRGFLGIGKRLAKIGVQSKPKQRSRAAVVKKEPAVPSKKRLSQQPTSAKEKKIVPQAAAKKLTDKEAEAAEMERRHQANLNKMQTASQELIKYLTAVFKEFGIKVNPRVVNMRAHELTIDLHADKTSRVIGFHGRRLNAIEQLGTAFLTYQGVDDPGLVLDTANYREKRRQSLEKLASRCVTEVIATGQAVFLDPMPARERKYLHRVLENNPHVKTYSHGREPYRSVVVAAKN